MEYELGRVAESYGETRLWEGEISYSTSPKSKGRPRHLVVGTLWLLVFKPRHTRKPELALHHLDLESLDLDSDALVLRHRSRKSATHLRCDSRTDLTLELSKTLRVALRDLHHNSPEPSYLSLGKSSPSLTTGSGFPPYTCDPGQSAGAAYRGWCSRAGLPFREEFGRFVSAVAARRPLPGSGLKERPDDLTLDLTLCPGIDGQSDSVVEIVPAVQAMAHDQYFRGLELRDCDQKSAGGVMSALGWALGRDCGLTLAAVERCWGEQDLAPLAGAMSSTSGSCALSVLSLAGTRASGSSFARLCSAIAGLRRPMVSLDFTDCRLGPKCAAALFASLLQGDYVTASLQHLSVSGCRLDALGTASLVAWLDNYKGKLPLKTLGLARSSPDVALLLPVLRNCTSLQRIDLSGNALNRIELVEMVRSLVVSCERPLEFLGLKDVSMPPESLEGFVSAFAKSGRTTGAALILAENSLGPAAGAAISRAALSVSNLVHIDVSRNKLGSKGLCELLGGLFHCSSLASADLSNNLSSDDSAEVFPKLVNFLCCAPALTALGFSATKQRPKHGRDCMPLIRHLAENKALRYIDITGLRFGDSGAAELGKSLRTNTSLTQISMDRNRVGLAGMQYIAQALLDNHTLQYLDRPVADLEAFNESVSSSDSVRRETMAITLDSIRDRLVENFRELHVPEFLWPVAMPRLHAPPPDLTVPTIVPKTTSTYLPPITKLSELSTTPSPRGGDSSFPSVSPRTTPTNQPMSKPAALAPPPLPPRSDGQNDKTLYRSSTTMALSTDRDDQPPPLRKSEGCPMYPDNRALEAHGSASASASSSPSSSSVDESPEQSSAPPPPPPPPPLPNWSH